MLQEVSYDWLAFKIRGHKFHIPICLTALLSSEMSGLTGVGCDGTYLTQVAYLYN